MGDLLRTAASADHIVGEFSAVAIGDRYDDELRIEPGIQLDFCDLGKVFAQDIGILGRILGQPMKIDLLEKVLLRGGPIRSGIARIPESPGVWAPLQAAAARGELHSRNLRP